MAGPKGNSEFCFPETCNVSQGEAEGNIKVKGYTCQLKNGKSWEKNCLLDAGWVTNLPWFQGALPD